MRLAEAHRDKNEIAKQLRDSEKQIETLLERIVEADNAGVIRAYEGKIAKLEREKLLLTEKAARIVPPKGRLEEFIEPALEFFETIGISMKMTDWPSKEQCSDWLLQSLYGTRVNRVIEPPIPPFLSRR